ncbi:HipA N-terminal domain-containing protein [Sorangium sp. So ce302]|uniref:HipA N-terminal domain-containing protein n=1 Tax=Sorangium sp. So ce302 TaxID=3133297 RepID=UPI003F5E8AE9
MVHRKPVTLLHLSDLQFGPHHRFEGPSSPGSLLQRLRDDLDRLREEEGTRPDLVLLTGDLTEYGMKSQFDQLLSFAHGLTEVTELPPRRVVVVPGNHDVNWKLCQAYFAEREGNEERPLLPYWPKLRPYAEFFARFYEGQTGIQFTEAEPWTLFEYPDLRVVVAGVNSAIAESHRPEDHYGFIGEQQLRFFAGKLRPYREQGFLRIAAIHHDPLHPGENDTARQDAKDLKGMLRPYLNLVVHGHLHEEQLGWLDNDVPVLGIGSAGVKVPERPPEVPNQYQIVQVYPDRLAYGTRAYVPDQKRWIGCLRSDPEGRAWRIEKRVGFERVDGTFSGSAEAVASPLADLAQMVDAYRRHWADFYRRETLFDLATMGEDADIPAGLDLLHVFLPQTARREPPRLDLPRDLGGDLDDDERLGKLPQRTSADDARHRTAIVGPPQPIDRVLTSLGEPWVLILGAPGAGKSALTRWLVLKLCTPGESLGDLPADLVPVRIELRRFDLHYRQCRQAGRSCDFFDYLDEIHRERNLSLRGESLRRLAEAGRLLWLIDGLDEVADPHARRDYAAMIVGVRDRYAGRGVVTSRIVGARLAQPLFQQAGLATYTLQEFDERQIDAFLERWHRLAFPGAPEAAARRLERLRQTLKESRPVRELCSNPLLLTLIALLNRGAELPRQRHRLYERAVDLMAEQWEANKPLASAGAIQFDLASKKRFLRRLAFLMMTELAGGSGNAVRQRDLSTFAASFCAEAYGIRAEEAQATAEHLIQHLRERNYILALIGGQTFGFVHKTFLEYLAAAEIHARFRSHEWGLDEIKAVFRKNWQDQAWEETLTLLCGMIEEERPQQVIELLQSVLEDVDPFEDHPVYSFVSFAVRCLAEIRLLDQEPVRSFARKLTDCILGYHFAPWFLMDKLPAALRLRGPEWPDAARIVAAALEAKSQQKQNKTLFVLNECAFAVSTKQERVTRLTELAFNQKSEFRLINGVMEAGRLGEWTAAEASSLHDVVEKLKEPAKTRASIALLDSGMTWAASSVAAVMRGREDPRLRYSAALALLRIPEWRSEAVSIVVGAIRSAHGPLSGVDVELLLKAAEEPSLREQVRSLLYMKRIHVRDREEIARELALHWHDEEALSIWTKAIFTKGDESLFTGVDAVMLEKLAREHTGVQRALSHAQDDITKVKRLCPRIVIAQWMAGRNDPRGIEALREMAFSDSLFARIRHLAAEALLDVPSVRRLGVDALVLLVHEGTDHYSDDAFFELLQRARSLPEARAGLWRLLEGELRDDRRLTACRRLASREGENRTEAIQHIRQLAAASNDEAVRVHAAAYLRDTGHSEPEWRAVLVHLARHAKRGSTRLLAAKALRDEGRIARIAARAKSAKVRTAASAALEDLRIYRALLQVGRPRRGVVSLDGTRAGVIEEIPGGSRFIYDRSYLARPGAIPLSPTLPLRPDPYDSRGLHPFFENLLPEGWLLDQTCRKLGLDRTDAFGLMLATCADCAGAVEIVPDKLSVAA